MLPTAGGFAPGGRLSIQPNRPSNPAYLTPNTAAIPAPGNAEATPTPHE